ncbi:hypothetical protein N665_0357s0016 [Sinapis alba]|nr:hypothetical protein N665_0357s0016 [Sinapis alba]
MELIDIEIKLSRQAMIGFNGSSEKSLGTIHLLTYVGGIMLDTKFTVIEFLDMYNIILGTPWIHAMKVVPSTYHQCIKFLTAEGITTIHGRQKAARMCHIHESLFRGPNRL